MALANRITALLAVAVMSLTTAWFVPSYAQGPLAEKLLVLKNPRIPGIHGEISFSRADLESLEQQQIRTSNDFVDGIATFRGPSAYALIDQIGRAGAKTVRMVAANDYFVDIEIEELERYGAILALEMNEERLTTRDRGPIWLMYPIDQHEELQISAINNRLIWQLQTIELR